jgi:hypothetical protein
MSDNDEPVDNDPVDTGGNEDDEEDSAEVSDGVK